MMALFLADLILQTHYILLLTVGTILLGSFSRYLCNWH